MPFNSDWMKPSNVAYMPLNKGIVRDRPSNFIDAGAFWDIENFHITDYTLKRRGGFYPKIESTTITEPIIDVFSVENDGSKETLILTEERLFQLSNDGLTEYKIDVAYVSPTWGIDGNGRITAIVDADTIAQLRAGVEVYEGSNLIGVILAFSGTTVVISNPSGIASVVGFGQFNSFNRWLGYRGIHANHAYLPGAYDEVIITGYAKTGLFTYSSATGVQRFALQGLNSTPTTIQHAKAVSYFSDRLWLGNVTVGGKDYTRRIYWSELGQFETFDSLSFLDLPDNEGDLITIKPLGNLLVLYFTDSIYIGRPTNEFGLPYKFERFEASDLGLQSNKSVISWFDGHFLVLNDDVYHLTNTLALQAIGSPVKELTVDVSTANGLMQDVMIAPDVRNNDIVFFFPDERNSANASFGSASVLWRYHFKTNAWAKDKASLNSLNTPRYYFTGVFSSYFYTITKTWEDWINDGPYSPDALTVLGEPYPTDGAVAWDGGDNVNWSDYQYWFDLDSSLEENKSLYIGISQGVNQGLYLEEFANESDLINSNSYPIVESLISPDSDFRLPDTDKTITRCSFKLKKFSPEAFSLRFYSSNNRGQTYRPEGYWRILQNEDEGRVDFLSTGSNFRFKLIALEDVPKTSYEIQSYVLRTAGGGLQIDDI